MRFADGARLSRRKKRTLSVSIGIAGLETKDDTIDTLIKRCGLYGAYVTRFKHSKAKQDFHAECLQEHNVNQCIQSANAKN
jgi:hypothetical protein